MSLEGRSREIQRLKYKRGAQGVAVIGDMRYVIGGGKKRYYSETVKNMTEEEKREREIVN